MPNSGTTPGAGGPSEIGAVSVGVTANTAPLKAGLKEAEATVAASGAKMGEEAVKAGTKAGAGFGLGIGHELRRAGRFFHHSILGFMFIPTITREAYELGKKIREALTDGMEAGRERASDLLNSLGAGDVKQAEQNLEKIRDRIAEINAQLGLMHSPARNRYWEGFRAFFRPHEEAGLRAEKDRLQASEKSDEKQRQAAEKEAKRKRIAENINKDQIEVAKEALRLQEQLDEEALTAQEKIEKKYQDIMRLVAELQVLGDRAGADRLATSAAGSRDRALRELAQHMDRIFKEIGNHIADEVRNSIRDVARDVVPDLRAIGPKLEWMGRTANRFAGRG